MVLSNNSESAWIKLFQFPSHYFWAPARDDHHRSLASHVIKADDDNPKDVANLPRIGPKMSARDPLNIIAGGVTAKLEEGDFSGVSLF